MLFRLATGRSSRVEQRLSHFSNRLFATFGAAHGEVMGNDRNNQIAFLGTGPMSLSMAANMIKTAENNNSAVPKVVLLTEQDSYYNALKLKGFTVIDERDGSKIVVDASNLIVVKNVEEYKKMEPSTQAPKIIFGTMQMGQKAERWGLVNVAAERLGDNQVTVLTAANGIPFTTMLDTIGNLKVRTGHATLYAKGRVEIKGDNITVTTTDNGRITVGAVASDIEKSELENPWFENIRALMDGPVYQTEMSPNAAKEAMTKVIRNLTNCICLGLTTAQYIFAGSSADLKAIPYGDHLKKKAFLDTLNIATYQACRAVGLDSKETAVQIIENLKYVLGPAVANLKGDLDAMRLQFWDGVDDIKTLEKQRPSMNSAEVRDRMFRDLSRRITLKLRKKLYKEAGSSHPPTDAQAAALAERKTGGRFGAFVPTKPIENKVTELIRLGRGRKCSSEHMNVLEAFSDLYDAYNRAVKDKTVLDIPESFFKVIEGCQDESNLLANVDGRVLKLNWGVAEIKNNVGISVAAQRKQWLGESAIRNAKLIAELSKKGFTFLRFDVGGVGLAEHPKVIEARQQFAAGNNKYSPICEPEVLDSLAQFYTDTGGGRVFKPSEVFVLGMRSKGALPWMLDFVGQGPVFVPRPTYNPNPSAGLYHQRSVLSFDVTGPNRYMPMIEAIRKHKGSGIIVLPIIGNPYSTTLTAEEEQGFIDILRNNQSMGWFGDHAYRGYNCYKDDNGNMQFIKGAKTRDVMEAGGFYDESPKDPVTGEMRHFRVTTHSSSKLFNDASGPGTTAAHADTITFLGDMLRGSFTQAHQRDRRTIPAIVENIDYDAPRRWMDAMDAFDGVVGNNVPGFSDLGNDTPPFKVYNASEFLRKYELHPEEAQHYFMSRSPGLCGIFGGFGPGTNEIFRLGFTGETHERAILAGQKFIEYVNDEEAIAKFKAREDELTVTFFKALKEIQDAEDS